MNIPIDTNLQDFFLIYLEVLNPILKLKKREKQVLAAFLKVHYSNRDKHPDRLNAILFSTQTKKLIRDSIGMSEPSFNNHLHQLREKNAFIGNSINSLITSNYPNNGDLTIEYNFKVKG